MAPEDAPRFLLLPLTSEARGLMWLLKYTKCVAMVLWLSFLPGCSPPTHAKQVRVPLTWVGAATALGVCAKLAQGPSVTAFSVPLLEAHEESGHRFHEQLWIQDPHPFSHPQLWL